MAEDITKKAEKEIKYIYEKVHSVDLDKIETEGVTLRAGNKVMRLSVIDAGQSIEDEIREEFRALLNKRLLQIMEDVNEKISGMSMFVSNVKNDYDKKERELNKKLDNARVMPEINYDHARNGLSIAKGSSRDSIVWFVRGIYAPKTVDFKPIETKFAQKLITDIIFQIDTVGNKITNLSTHKVIGLDYFSHYHQNNPDCWNKFKWDTTWKRPEDIIKIARDAEAVLENINSSSIAKHSPAKLPHFDTVRNHINTSPSNKKSEKIRKEMLRTGISTDMRVSDDIWQT